MTASERDPRPVFVLRIQPEPQMSLEQATRSLRAILKGFLRLHGMKCLTVEREATIEADKPERLNHEAKNSAIGDSNCRPEVLTLQEHRSENRAHYGNAVFSGGSDETAPSVPVDRPKAESPPLLTRAETSNAGMPCDDMEGRADEQ